MKTKKEITLGYVSMYNYKKDTPLFECEGIEDEEWKREIERDIKKFPADEIILPSNRKYTLIIDYPLTKPFKNIFSTGKRGMTRRSVVNFIVKCYRKIYDEEDKTSSTRAKYISGMFNRDETNGKYGIWGHCLGDLVLHTLCVKKDILEVGVDS